MSRPEPQPPIAEYFLLFIAALVVLIIISELI